MISNVHLEMSTVVKYVELFQHTITIKILDLYILKWKDDYNICY